MTEQWLIAEQLRADVETLRADLVAAQARAAALEAERDEMTNQALRVAGDLSICRDLIRDWIKTGAICYRPGCRCTGCRRVARALGER